ncbi:60S ribosomal protein L27 [Candidozyma auris]|nr:60S ribosomal protein L27 [[Candida] auris]
MAKFIKSGRVAIVTRGRFAGKKVVVVRPHDEGTKAHSFPTSWLSALRGPQRITKAHDAKKVAKRTRVKPFVKAINYNHLMPTRYSLDVESFKNAITTDALAEPSQKEEAKKVVRKALEEKHQAGKNKWFFQKLNF